MEQTAVLFQTFASHVCYAPLPSCDRRKQGPASQYFHFHPIQMYHHCKADAKRKEKQIAWGGQS